MQALMQHINQHNYFSLVPNSSFSLLTNEKKHVEKNVKLQPETNLNINHCFQRTNLLFQKKI